MDDRRTCTTTTTMMNMMMVTAPTTPTTMPMSKFVLKPSPVVVAFGLDCTSSTSVSNSCQHNISNSTTATIWLTPIAHERVGVQVKRRNPLRIPAIPERFCGSDSLQRGAISSVCTFTTTTNNNNNNNNDKNNSNHNNINKTNEQNKLWKMETKVDQ